MAHVSTYPFLRHLRSEPSVHAIRFRNGQVVTEGRGLAFFFRPRNTGVAEVPVDDRDVTFLFRTRTNDFQELSVQGVLTYRVTHPTLLADRVDFTIDLAAGEWRKEPLEQVGGLLTQLAQQLTLDLIARATLTEAVRAGLEPIRTVVLDGLSEDPRLADLGLQVVAVRVQALLPTAEMEQALQTPVQERVQQQADEARFGRRAMAVEKERAIAENELASRLELTKREEDLIAQQGANHRRTVEDDAAAARIETEARLQRQDLEVAAQAERQRLLAEVEAATTRVTADAEADATRANGQATASSEELMMAIYKDLPMPVMIGLALRELAGKLERIDHLNLAPDALGPMLTNLMTAATGRLEGGDR